MIRLILWTILIYLVYKIVQRFWNPPVKKQSTIQGDDKKKPLDLSEQDVEDAKFEEIKSRK